MRSNLYQTVLARQAKRDRIEAALARARMPLPVGLTVDDIVYEPTLADIVDILNYREKGFRPVVTVDRVSCPTRSVR